MWKLVDPKAAFAEWFALLKPGGTLLIVDGNMGKKTWAGRLNEAVARITGRPARRHMDAATMERHERIRSQVYFSAGMPAEAVVRMLGEAGFVEIVVDRALFGIHWAQAKRMAPLRALERMTQDRFAISARKPL